MQGKNDKKGLTDSFTLCVRSELLTGLPLVPKLNLGTSGIKLSLRYRINYFNMST